MHQKQRKILSLLMEADPVGQKFSALQTQFKSTDKLSYHLNYLKKKSYISNERNKYRLTNTGAFQFKHFDAKTLLDTKHKLPTLVLVYKIGNKFLLKKFNDTSYGLYPINLLVAQTTEEVIQEKMAEYGFTSSSVKYRCSQNMIVRENSELIYDNIWIVYDVKLESYSGANDSFKLFSLEEIKKFGIVDELTTEFVVENNREPFSTKVINITAE